MSYTEYDSIKIKLRIANDSMRDEIELYMQEIDDLLDNRLRARLGARNIYGDEIVLPLTSETIPELPLELKGIANNLVVAKIRLQNSEKPMLWDAEVNILDNYLDRVYGYIRGTIVTTPVSVISTSTGSFSFTFPIPANTADGAVTLKVNDTFGGLVENFQVI